MKVVFLVVTLLMFVASSAAQRHIEFDGLNVPRTVKVPTSILRLLRDELLANTHLPAICRVDKSTDITAWFSTSRIDLGERPRAYLITPDKECLTPVDHTRFWIARKTRHGYRLVLQAGAIVLDALKTRTHGLRDLETNACTAAYCYRDLYKFDGSLYHVRFCSVAENGVRPKYHRVSCRQ